MCPLSHYKRGHKDLYHSLETEHVCFFVFIIWEKNKNIQFILTQ